MRTKFLSNHCILSLDLKVKIQAKNTVVCMGSLPPLNAHISSHFGTIQLKLSTHDYFMVLFRSMSLKYENSKSISLRHYHVVSLLPTSTVYQLKAD